MTVKQFLVGIPSYLWKQTEGYWFIPPFNSPRKCELCGWREDFGFGVKLYGRFDKETNGVKNICTLHEGFKDWNVFTGAEIDLLNFPVWSLGAVVLFGKTTHLLMRIVKFVHSLVVTTWGFVRHPILSMTVWEMFV